MSPEELEEARRLYEETDAPVVAIAERLGLGLSTFYVRVRAWRWRRRRRCRPGPLETMARAGRGEDVSGVREEWLDERWAPDAQVAERAPAEVERRPRDPLDEAATFARALASYLKAIRMLEAVDREAAEAARRTAAPREEDIDPDEIRERLLARLERINAEVAAADDAVTPDDPVCSIILQGRLKKTR